MNNEFDNDLDFDNDELDFDLDMDMDEPDHDEDFEIEEDEDEDEEEEYSVAFLKSRELGRQNGEDYYFVDEYSTKLTARDEELNNEINKLENRYGEEFSLKAKNRIKVLMEVWCMEPEKAYKQARAEFRGEHPELERRKNK